MMIEDPRDLPFTPTLRGEIVLACGCSVGVTTLTADPHEVLIVSLIMQTGDGRLIPIGLNPRHARFVAAQLIDAAAEIEAQRAGAPSDPAATPTRGDADHA